MTTDSPRRSGSPRHSTATKELLAHALSRLAMPAAFVSTKSAAPPDIPEESAATTSQLAEPLHQQAAAYAIIGLFALACLYTMHLAKAILLPIAIAILLDFLFSPVVRWLRKRRIREPLGAALIMIAVLSLVAGLTSALSTPAVAWVTKAPTMITQIQKRLKQVSAPLARLQRTATQVQEATRAVASEPNAPARVEVVGPSLVSRVFGSTTEAITASLTIFFLTYFLLASGSMFLRKVLQLLSQWSYARKAVTMTREIERLVSRYLVTITLIHTGVGLLTWALLAAIGLPNAALWGAIAGLLNFIPYLGAWTMVVLLALVGLVSSDTTGQAMLAPGGFLLINTFEAQVITPAVMGRRLPLNPVALFIGVIVWGYLWGVPGAIIAVPLMVTIKVVCDHI
ncbi:MAG: AI-2E family transporter, partial [Gemmatimonadaceae bacterium]